MDLLSAAKAYRDLMRYRYTFLLGHKGKAETMTLEFTKEAFHHLAGLHKKALERVKNKKYALDYILIDGIIPQADFSDEVLDRWDCICNLKAMIESNSLVFRLRKKELPGSSIRAEYLLTDDLHLFFVDQSQPVAGQHFYRTGRPAEKRCTMSSPDHTENHQRGHLYRGF